MEQERNWSDALSEQDIPAEAVDWDSIIAGPAEEGMSEEAQRLDAEATIGEPPADAQDEEE